MFVPLFIKGSTVSKKNIITVRPNGPFGVKGQLQLDGQDPVEELWLCRCGLSQKKPFCDGAHSAEGFSDADAPAPAPVEAIDLPEGPLSIRSLANGPLLLNGPVEVQSDSGEVIKRAKKMALCRCGHSKNKPYCDGAHSAAGFCA